MWKPERKQLSFHENQSIGIDPDESILQTYITTQYDQERIPAMLKLDGACGKLRGNKYHFMKTKEKTENQYNSFYKHTQQHRIRKVIFE